MILRKSRVTNSSLAQIVNTFKIRSHHSSALTPHVANEQTEARLIARSVLLPELTHVARARASERVCVAEHTCQSLFMNVWQARAKLSCRDLMLRMFVTRERRLPPRLGWQNKQHGMSASCDNRRLACGEPGGRRGGGSAGLAT